MGSAELALTAARGLQVSAAMSTLGVAVFWSVVAPPVLRTAGGPTATDIEARLLGVFRASVIIGFLSAVTWFVLNTAYIAGSETAAETVQAMWPVATGTRFGHVLCLRVGILIVSALLFGSGADLGRVRLAAGGAGLSLILHVGQTHAAAIGGAAGAVLLGAEALHMLAAGAWLGSLIPLLVIVGAVPPAQGARAARRFTPLGATCAAVLAATALVQGWILIGGVPALVGTDYGQVALVKLALFLILLAIAATNRFRHTPALESAAGEDAKRRLRRSICLEVVTAVAAVIAAAVLASQAPARQVQSAKPFAGAAVENVTTKCDSRLMA